MQKWTLYYYYEKQWKVVFQTEKNAVMITLSSKLVNKKETESKHITAFTSWNSVEREWGEELCHSKKLYDKDDLKDLVGKG